MRASIDVLLSLLALLGVSWLACRSAPVPEALPSEAPGDAAVRTGPFSADRAWKHLEALAAIGPRVSGGPGAAAARVYIQQQLAGLGLEVKERSLTVSFDAPNVEDIELVNLRATIPGKSSDLIVLAAPYDSAHVESFEFQGVNDGASGVALLLELARIITADPLPYSVRLYFLDGESPLGRGTEEDAETQLLGSLATAGVLEAAGDLETIRLLLIFNRVSDADLRIARDLFSHRTHRDTIWRVAADLGHGDVFPSAAEFEAPVAGHRSFIDAGMRRTVAIVDPHFGADEVPDSGPYSEDDRLDRSSPESLAVVGDVTLASLHAISAALVRIDRFSEAPVFVKPEPALPEPEPESTEAPPAGEAAPP
jgi:hypothetical protein